MLEKEVISFNKSHYTDPIRIIWPEEELQLTEEDLLSNNLHNFRVERDKLIQKNIIETKNKTLPSQKGLILYGSGHGVKKSVIIKDDNSVEYEYKVFGSYLHDYYGKDFSTFLFWNVEPKQKSCIFLYSKDNDCRVLTDSEIKNSLRLRRNMIIIVCIQNL